MRSLRIYFVVKCLHFIKESKYFSLSFLYYETTKITEKIEKMYPWKWGFPIRHSAMEQFADLSFEYVKSVCKIYVLLESKCRHCSVTMAFVLDYLEFYRYFWGFWPNLESGGLFFINGPNFKFGPNCDVTYGKMLSFLGGSFYFASNLWTRRKLRNLYNIRLSVVLWTFCEACGAILLWNLYIS